LLPHQDLVVPNIRSAADVKHLVRKKKPNILEYLGYSCFFNYVLRGGIKYYLYGFTAPHTLYMAALMLVI
jgi:hypothetical protein